MKAEGEGAQKRSRVPSQPQGCRKMVETGKSTIFLEEQKTKRKGKL